jgi:hypothetical protein
MSIFNNLLKKERIVEMNMFKKIFGKKKKDPTLSEVLDDLGLELNVSFGDVSEELNEDEYKYNHCFIFYGLNENALSAIENQVQNYDGPDHLSLLRSMDGVFMTALCEQKAGSEKAKEAMKTDDDSIAYVNQRFDQYLEIIKENSNSPIGERCLELVDVEKPYIAENIRCAMRVWVESEYFEKEDFIGAMIVYVKSSKKFDRKDTLSNDQNGFNLPLVARGGLISNCIHATEDAINVKYDIEKIDDIRIDSDGKSQRNVNNYITPFYGGPFGFNYFDQDGQLWRIVDVDKEVKLASEWEKDFVDDDEDPDEYIVSN